MRKGGLIWILVIGLTLLLAVLAISCAGPGGPAGPAGTAGPAGPAGPAGSTGLVSTAATATCSECHNDTTLIVSKKLQWEQSTHATGGNYVRGTSASCAGCHSSEGFTARIAAGVDPDEVEAGIPNPSPQNCRTCHQVHTTYTKVDFALKTIAPVTLMVSGETFDMGNGNLCANCHQPRRGPDNVTNDDGVNSTHWGPHHGMEAAMLLGIGGYDVPGSPSGHYLMVKDGCADCHLGPDKGHTLTPQLSACATCHGELDSFDRNGVQSEVKAMFHEAEGLLEAKGLLHDGHPVVGKYSDAEEGALWNWLVVKEDASWGVHNSQYTKALLESALEALR